MTSAAQRGDEAGGRRDGDQAGDDAGGQAQRGRLALVQPLGQHPAQAGRGRGDLRGRRAPSRPARRCPGRCRR